MRNMLFGLAAIGILASTVGCANGPLRQWLRGDPCNTCNPQFGHATGENYIGGCAQGACSTGNCSSDVCNTAPTGSGLLGGVFGNNGGVFGNHAAASSPPQSVPASALNQPASFGTPELYGNTTNVGRIELPPSGPFN